MVDRNLIREFRVDEDALEQAFAAVMEDQEVEDIDDFFWKEIIQGEAFDVNQITEGTVLRVDGDDVLVDIGYKSEGMVHINEWTEDEDPPEAGQKVQVLLEEVEDDFGLILLSKRKADRIREWNEVIEKHDEGDIVTGKVVRKIKGGLLVNIGVNVFLPASQVDIRRPSDIAEYIDQDIECVILKIDESRRNIVVSRRKLIEDKRKELKDNLLAEIEENQIRKGVVKNIADFGAFVDLGGIDGLLHITDMSYDRIKHPTEMVSIDDEIEVMILNIDREKEKIALGLKQKFPDPWQNVETKYPVGEKISGEVVNVMTYGAFVKLEAGVEGLVHISEMSWVKRINHPSEMVNIGDVVDVVVLGINMDKQEISLGMKQTQPNPWDDVSEKYPEGSKVNGTVRNLTNYGAFIELEEGVDGLLHVSDMSHTKKLSHANEMLKRGEEIECVVISVDEERKRIALGLKQLSNDPWEDDIPSRYEPGTIVKGKVTKITNFGVFVELEEDLEGLLHISELAEHKVDNPEDEVNPGEEIEVRVLRVDIHDRKIGLSRKLSVEEQVEATEYSDTGNTGAAGSGLPRELKGGTGTGEAGPLFSMSADEAETQQETVAGETAEATDVVEEAEATETVEATDENTDGAPEASAEEGEAAEQVEGEAESEEDEEAKPED